MSASTYDDVFKFRRYKEAFDFTRGLIFADPPIYDATVKRVCKAGNGKFYLSGN